jgi:hypothetical protein
MPEGDFVPYAVAGSRTPPRDWWRDFSLARRLIEEWVKYRASAMMAGEPAPQAASPSPKGDDPKPKATR